MNNESVRPTPRIPLPQGPDHEAWVFDWTPVAWLRKTWTPATAPYSYTPAAQVVRRVMPMQGLIKYPRLLTRLTDHVHRDRAVINERFGWTDEYTDADIAMWLIGKVLIETGTPFVVFNIEPSGSTVMFHRLRAFRTRHPDSPNRGDR